MDVITTAIIVALANLSKNAIKDSYNALKSALKKKFGANSDLVDAVGKLEKKISSKGRLSDCVDNIFQTNVKNGLAKEQALAIINAADQYATTPLSPPLYSLHGIRRQINHEFGFAYKLDMEK